MFVVTYLITRELILPTLLTLLHELSHGLFYYCYEKLWEKYIS